MDIINYEDKADKIKMEDIIFHGTDMQNYSSLSINWALLDGCNYRCSYCFGQEQLAKQDFIPIEKLKSALDKIFKIEKEHYSFTLSGGEVTYHPHFLEFIQYLFSFKKKISVLVISNASRNIDFFEKMLSYVGDNTFTLLFSVHFEYAQIDHIKELIMLFNKYNANIKIKFMLHPDFKEKIYEYFDILIKMREKYIFEFHLEELREPPLFDKVDSRYDDNFFKWIYNSIKKISHIINNSNIKELYGGGGYICLQLIIKFCIIIKLIIF